MNSRFLRCLFLALTFLVASSPFYGQTAGFHRLGQVLARSPGGVTALVVPNARINVTNSATGLAATIYSDVNLTVQISPPILTADASGQYDYYVAPNYCVNEAISSPGQGFQAIRNICQTTASNGAGGTNTQVQYNNNGILGGSVATLDGAGNFTTPAIITVGGPLPTNHLTFQNSGTMPAPWTFDFTTPQTAMDSLGNGGSTTATFDGLTMGGPTNRLSFTHLAPISTPWTFDFTSPQTAINSLVNGGSSLVPIFNGARFADAYAGADNGAKVNAAVADWKANGGSCAIYLMLPGTISTAPDIPLGCSLDMYAPQTLTVTWPVRHHGTLIDFHGKRIVANTGSTPAFDIGKVSAINFTGTVNTSGTVVTWASGPDFSDIDLGDQITIGPSLYNIASITSSTQLSVTASAGTQTGVTYSVYMDSSNAIPNNPTAMGPTLRNLSLVVGTTTGDAIRNTASSDVRIEKPSIFGTFNAGYESRGSIVALVNGLTCSGCKSGLILTRYTIGGFTSGSNANMFPALSLVASLSASANAIYVGTGNSGNFFGAHIEGNQNDVVIDELGGGDHYQFADYERNGTGSIGDYEIVLGSSYNLIDGPAELQTYNPLLLAFEDGTVGNVVENMYFSASGGGAVAYSFLGSATGRVINNTISAGITNGPSSGIEDASNNYTTADLHLHGILSTNGAFTTGSSAGDVVVRNGNCVRGNNHLNNASYCLVGVSNDASDRVVIDSGLQGTVVGGSLKFGTGTVFLTNSDAIMRTCGTVAFSASTTSAALSCSFVTVSSKCSATWAGTGVTGGALGYTASAGSVTLTAANSNSSTAQVACSVN